MVHMTTEATGAQPPDCLASRIHRARRYAGLSSQALADQLGVHRNTIARWEDEHADAAPAATDVVVIARELGVDPTWLLGLEPAAS
jgi:transcriptional regulator with XRE-family HTH domain